MKTSRAHHSSKRTRTGQPKTGHRNSEPDTPASPATPDVRCCGEHDRSRSCDRIMPTESDVTGLLLAWRQGDSAAVDRLFPLVYDELRRLAHRQLDRERSDHTFGTTGLVHEAYLKLVDQTRAQWMDRGHFFAIAAR